ncbi:MAG: hypothetical protein UX94_C0008G0009 [Parcubacteria group bacterium GW2011_GWA2_47_21]|nr:MAG: hypothetical protein UX94_C0008G0009 [Parcubacteria group bacterium GW2011_GWA2_47_21]
MINNQPSRALGVGRQSPPKESKLPTGQATNHTANPIHLGELLNRFDKYKKASLPKRISEVFKENGISVNPKNISIKNRQIFVECSGAVKAGILMKKCQIIESLLKNKDIPDGSDIL